MIAKEMTDYLDDRQAKLQNLATELGVENVAHLENILVDPAYDLKGAIKLNSIATDLADPLAYTACYATAAATYNLLNGSLGIDLASGANKDSYATGDKFREVVTGLIGAMTIATEASVFRIEYAGHGFVLVVHPNGGDEAVEHLESLAHTAPMIENLREKCHYSLEEACLALAKMASDDIGVRRAGAETFGWNADMIFLGADPNNNGKIDFPHVRLKWWKTSLSSETQQDWEEQVKDRFDTLAEIVMVDYRL